jgi:gentisate 1,2-dioxygenase
MGRSVISAHVSEVPGRGFYNPHRHGPSAFVFSLGGPGYSLMWQDDAGHVERFDWPEDDVGVIVPPNMWWHGHFATKANVLTLAIKLRSRFVPINRLYDRSHKHVSEGGTVRRYEDLEESLRTKIWDTYVSECAKYDGAPVVPERSAA